MIPVAIKRVHGRFNASKLIEFITKKVQLYNKKWKGKDSSVKNIEYELHLPHAYALSETSIMMAKTTAPTLQEVLDQKTDRAKAMQVDWEQNGLDVQRMMWKLRYVGQDIALNVDIRMDNLFVMVSKTGKIDLYPIPDEY